jgi:hypothetical protein
MKQSKASLFLMELIICILFFSLAAAVCVQLFVRSHNLSKRTVEQSQAVIIAENLAECFFAAEGDTDQIIGYYDHADTSVVPEVPLTHPVITLYYDAEFRELAGAEQAVYLAQLTVMEPGEYTNIGSDLTAGVITLREASAVDPFYELDVNVHKRLSLGDIQ